MTEHAKEKRNEEIAEELAEKASENRELLAQVGKLRDAVKHSKLHFENACSCREHKWCGISEHIHEALASTEEKKDG